MKSALYLLLFIVTLESVTAQAQKRRQYICLIAHIPVLIESDPVIYNFDQKGNFNMGSGRIRISQIKRSFPLEFDHLIQWNKPLPIDQQNKVKPFLQLGTTTKRLIEYSDKTTHDVLIDTILTPKQKLTLIWQDLNNTAIQSITLSSAAIVPEIIGTKQFKSFDSIDQAHKARQIKRIQSLPEGYQRFQNKKLEVDPGSHIEMKMKPYALLPDSSIQYRLSNTRKKIIGAWLFSGHILTLSDITPNEVYTLELKYIGQDIIKSYQVIANPYWHQKLWIRITLVLVMMLITILTTRWYYRRRLKLINSQRQRLEEQLTTIQSQLNPHFIFNALNSIEGLVTSGENKQANGYLNTFSAIMRETLKNSDKLLINLKEDIELLEKYLSIEKLRFGFSYKLHIDEQINIHELEIPPMLIQPIVENAIKHGVGSLGREGLIEVILKRNAENMIITVINNRIIDKKALKTAGGYGLSFTKQRLAHFNQLNPKTNILYTYKEEDLRVEVQLIFEHWFT